MRDPFQGLEDLNSPEARRLIERARRELEKLLGDLPEKLLPLARRAAARRRARGLAPLGGGVAVLYRGTGGGEAAYLPGPGGQARLLARAPRGAVFTGLEPAPGCGAVALHVSPGGRDEGYVVLLREDGSEAARLEGSVHSVSCIGGRLVYVRMYRRGRSPDGAEAPVSRIVARGPGGEEMLWGPGEVRRGELLYARYLPGAGLYAAVVYEGWSRSRLYLGEEPERLRYVASFEGPAGIAGELGGGAAVLLRGPRGGKLVAARGPGSLETVAELERPVEAAAAAGDSAAVAVIVDSRHIVLGIRGGRVLWRREPGEPATVVALEPGGKRFYVLWTSFTRPHMVEALGPEGEARILEEPGWRLDAEVSEIWARSRDGTMVHAWLVSPRGRRPRAVVAWGYGGFGVSLTPAYRPQIEMTLSMGMAWLQANLRGGGEEGEEWHRQGMRRNKHRVFEDMEAVLQAVRMLGCRVAAWGVSNGGLLVAAVETRNPELLDAAVIGYPVLDMLRFHRLYVGRVWVPEYGDPENPEDREYLEKISPYNNIPAAGEKELPPTLLYTGLGDDRVHPGHALKYYAKARSLGHRCVFLRVAEESGHSGSDAETQARELADIAAFLEKALFSGERFS